MNKLMSFASLCLLILGVSAEAKAADPDFSVGGGIGIKLGGADIGHAGHGFALSIQPELDIRGFTTEGGGIGTFVALQGTGIVPDGAEDGLTLSQGSALIGILVYPARKVELRAYAGPTRVTADVSNQSMLLGSGALFGLGLNVNVTGPFSIGVDYQHSDFTASTEFATAASLTDFAIGQLSLALNLLW